MKKNQEARNGTIVINGAISPVLEETDRRIETFSHPVLCRYIKWQSHQMKPRQTILDLIVIENEITMVRARRKLHRLLIARRILRRDGKNLDQNTKEIKNCTMELTGAMQKVAKIMGEART